MLILNMNIRKISSFKVKTDKNGRLTIPKCLIDSVFAEKVHEILAYHCKDKNTVILAPANDSSIFSNEKFKKIFPNGKFHFYIPTPSGSLRFRVSLADAELNARINEYFNHEIIEVTL